MGMTLPIRLGGEIAGTIAALGAGVDSFDEGDPVFGMVKSGGFAEYVIAKSSEVVAKPKILDFVQAAAGHSVR
jgi:NADPH:quinone reductase-like Zn-dependent oxidoreductase